MSSKFVYFTLRNQNINKDDVVSKMRSSFATAASDKKVVIDLAENRIDSEGVRNIVEVLQGEKNLCVRLWMNNFSFMEMYSVLLDMDATELLVSGRITAEDTPAGRALEKQAIQNMSVMGNVDRLTQQITKWIGTDATSIEMEVTAAVKEALTGGYSLGITKIVGDNGQDLVEWDGVVSGRLAGDNVLVLVETKHLVLDADITSQKPNNPGMIQRLEIFKDFYDSLGDQLPESSSNKQKAQYDLYKRYSGCKIIGAIGGPHFNESVKALAKKKGLLVVHTDGSRYVVE